MLKSVFCLVSLYFLLVLSGCASLKTGSLPADPENRPGLVRPLPQADLNRIAYAWNDFQAVMRDWPWIRSEKICLLYVNVDAHWLLNCDADEATGFAPTSQQFMGHPILGATNDIIPFGFKQYRRNEFTAKMPATMKNPLLDPDFKMKTRTWFFVNSLEAITALHPGFKGRNPTVEFWLSMITHEYFHTQHLSPDGPTSGVASEISHDQTMMQKLGEYFEKSETYRGAISKEFELLKQAVTDPALTKVKARKALSRWVALYQDRISKHRKTFSDLFPGNLERMDLIYTYVEGLPTYVENRYLLDLKLHASTVNLVENGFSNFAKYKQEGYTSLTNMKATRIYYRGIGAHLGLLLDVASPGWKKTLYRNPRWIIGKAEAIAQRDRSTFSK